MIHSGRTRLEVSEINRPRGRERTKTRSWCVNARQSATQSPGGSCVFNVVICRGEQLIRSPGLREARRPPRTFSPRRRCFAFLIAIATKTTTTTWMTTTYDKDDGGEGVMRQGILSLLWLPDWLATRCHSRTVLFLACMLHYIYIYICISEKF